jgi:hypothetical protein
MIVCKLNILESVLLTRICATLWEDSGLEEREEEHRRDCGSIHRLLLQYSPRRVSE